MSNYTSFAPQGWQCPICGRVFAPTTPMCWFCNTGENTSNTTGTYRVKWGHTESKTKAEGGTEGG